MATDPSVPFQFLAAGNAEAPKVQADFEAFLKYVRDRNDGTVAWDTFKMTGTTTNDSAAVGIVGEAARSSITTATNFPASGNYGDLTSISLTAGDWDISAQIVALLNASTTTAVEIGVSATSGNSGTGLISTDNQLDFTPPNATTNPTVATIAGYRVSIASTTTHYLKYRATYSAGTPQARGRISARRVR